MTNTSDKKCHESSGKNFCLWESGKTSQGSSIWTGLWTIEIISRERQRGPSVFKFSLGWESVSNGILQKTI